MDYSHCRHRPSRIHGYFSINFYSRPLMLDRDSRRRFGSRYFLISKESPLVVRCRSTTVINFRYSQSLGCAASCPSRISITELPIRSKLRSYFSVDLSITSALLFPGYIVRFDIFPVGIFLNLKGLLRELFVTNR